MLRSVVVLMLVGFCARSVVAADGIPSEDQVKQWVERLDSRKFAEREDATTKLITAGHAQAMLAVKQTVEKGSPEARTRATHILAMWHRSPDAAARQAVQAAAKRWQVSKDPRMARLGKAIVMRPVPADYHLQQTGNLWRSAVGRPVIIGGATAWGIDPATAFELRLR